MLTVAREAMERFPAGDPERRRLRDAAVLLERLLMQDIELREDGSRLKQGVSPDRVVSVHDPEMRHGRKSDASTGIRRRSRLIQREPVDHGGGCSGG